MGCGHHQPQFLQIRPALQGGVSGRRCDHAGDEGKIAEETMENLASSGTIIELYASEDSVNETEIDENNFYFKLLLDSF